MTYRYLMHNADKLYQLLDLVTDGFDKDDYLKRSKAYQDIIFRCQNLASSLFNDLSEYAKEHDERNV